MKRTLYFFFFALLFSSSLKGQDPFLITESMFSLNYQNQKLEGPLRSYLFHRFDPTQFPFSHDHYNYDPFLKTIETYQKYELSFQYKLNRKVLVRANIPYIENSRTNLSGEKLSGWKGLGDLSVGMKYQFYHHKLLQLKPKWDHQIWLGAKVYFPTGKEDRINKLSEIEPQLETGKGAFQFDFELNHWSTFSNFSIRSNFLFNYSRPNRFRYRFGKLFLADLLFDYQVRIKDWEWSPFIGAGYEWQESDFMNGQFLLDKTTNGEDTGHQLINLNVGSKLKWKQFCLIFGYKLPIQMDLYGQQLNPRGELSLNFNYLLISKQ